MSISATPPPCPIVSAFSFNIFSSPALGLFTKHRSRTTKPFLEMSSATDTSATTTISSALTMVSTWFQTTHAFCKSIKWNLIFLFHNPSMWICPFKCNRPFINSFVSNASILFNSTSRSGLLVNVLNTPNSLPEFGNIEFNVLLTDYTSFAFVIECQTIDFATDYKANVALLLRSVQNAELTVFRNLAAIMTMFRGLIATGYPGGPLEFVRRDPFCAGL